MHIIPISYRSTNYFILDNGKTKLLIDAGWPGTIGELKHALKQKDISLANINYVLVTHYHPDHAGLTQDIKNAGAKLIVLQQQLPFIAPLAGLIKPTAPFTPINTNDNIIISTQNSRPFLQQLGFNGEVLHTPGHSDDSITLLLDTGEAFIGDLPPGYTVEPGGGLVMSSWKALKTAGAKNIYPSHAKPFTIDC